MMTPRHRVLTALAHEEPDRVPFSWGFGPTPEMALVLTEFLQQRGIDWGRLRKETEHIVYVGPGYTGPELPPHTDIWGIRRKPQCYGTGEYHELEHCPLTGFETPAEAHAFPWPDPTAYDYAATRQQTLAAHAERRRATKLFAGNPLEIYSWMTGMEETMINFLVNPELVVACLGQITNFFEEKLQKTLLEIGDLVDIVFIADDLGGQNGLLFSREQYREILQPFHHRLCETTKKFAPQAKILYHSDGAVFAILPDLIDAGIDILEAVQVDAVGMDPQRLKETYGDRISFHGGISVQQLLPRGDSETVAAECRRLAAVFGKGGGYIAAPTHAIQMGTPPRNVMAMLGSIFAKEELDAALAAAAI